MQLSIVFVALIATSVASSAQDPPLKKRKTHDTQNQQDRKSAHQFLFDEFVTDRKAVFSKDQKFLKELVVYKNTNGQLVESGEEFLLPDGAQRIAGMFDNVILRGENLNGIVGVVLEPYSAHRMRLTHERKQQLTTKMRPFPVPRKNLPQIRLRIECRTPVMIDEIAFASAKGIGREFDLVRKDIAVNPTRSNAFESADAKFRNETINRSFDDLASSMSENSEAYVRLIVTAGITSNIDSFDFGSVLVDRRVAKLYEELARMDKDVAARRASNSFDAEFSKYKRSWEGTNVLASNHRYGVDALLFLCSEFCPPEEFSNKVERWSDWFDKTTGKGAQFEFSGGADFLMVSNLYANIIVKQRQLSIPEANALLANVIGPITKSRSLVLEGGALLSSDWTSDQIDVAALIPVSRVYPTRKKEVQKQILNALRQELMR